MGRKITSELSPAVTEKKQRRALRRDHLEKYEGFVFPHGSHAVLAEGKDCEFRDFCNRLYYIDGECRCTTSWRRSAGLALPVSA